MWSVMVLALAGPTPMLTMVMPLVGAHQVVGRHLRQARRRGAQLVAGLGQAHAARDHVAGLDEGDVFAVRLGHLGVAQAHELVDVELVVGEQHEVLEPLGRRAV
jgi:hypothetical protein